MSPSPPLSSAIPTHLGITPGAMPSTDQRTDTISAVPNGSALETASDKRIDAANNLSSAASTITDSETTDRTRDGDSLAASEDDDEQFLPSTPLSLTKLTAYVYNRVHGFVDEPSEDIRIIAVQEQARVSLQVIREAISRYGWRIPQ
jgi:hypothetical protein